MTIAYTLIAKRDCAHCGGNARCYNCIGSGVEEYEPQFIPCEECTGSGVCAECEDGKETWLMYEQGGRQRGSCLRRDEIKRFRADGTLPNWWSKFHKV